MRFLMLVCTDPEGEDVDLDTTEQWVFDTDSSGQRVLGERLRPPGDAKTVRVREGRLLVTDGPYAEAKEWIAGFDILECVDLDEAVAVAARHPMARAGRLEVRAFWSDQE
jgi:hypothetical protein